MLDLVDIFGTSSEAPPPPSDPWNSAEPTCNATSDPWDSVGEWFITSTQRPQDVPLTVIVSSLYVFNATHWVVSLLTAVHSSTPVIGSPWAGPAPPSSSDAANPWAPCPDSCTDPWEGAQVSSSPVDQAWDSPTDRGTLQKHRSHYVCWGFLCPRIKDFTVANVQVVIEEIRLLHRKRRSLNKRFRRCPPLNQLVPQVGWYGTDTVDCHMS